MLSGKYMVGKGGRVSPTRQRERLRVTKDLYDITESTEVFMRELGIKSGLW